MHKAFDRLRHSHKEDAAMHVLALQSNDCISAAVLQRAFAFAVRHHARSGRAPHRQARLGNGPEKAMRQSDIWRALRSTVRPRAACSPRSRKKDSFGERALADMRQKSVHITPEGALALVHVERLAARLRSPCWSRSRRGKDFSASSTGVSTCFGSFSIESQSTIRGGVLRPRGGCRKFRCPYPKNSPVSPPSVTRFRSGNTGSTPGVDLTTEGKSFHERRRLKGAHEQDALENGDVCALGARDLFRISSRARVWFRTPTIPKAAHKKQNWVSGSVPRSQRESIRHRYHLSLRTVSRHKYNHFRHEPTTDSGH